MAEGKTASTYDEIPYSSYPYQRTHPDRLCSLARLFGLPAADPAKCRVLELGCASGGNLIPMAEHLPGSEFVGLDLSLQQIETGCQVAQACEIGNVRLEQADLMTVDESWGRFDYIICHGVYSWVPNPVQTKILDLFRRLLHPDGVAYVSYNVYPGWHLRESVRHMMRFHVAQFDQPQQRIAQARALIDFLVDNTDKEGPYALLLNKELGILQRTGDDYLYHEHLEETNAPLYFHEFAERLADHDLQYLGETDVHTMLLREMSPEVSDTLGRITHDIIGMEQYMDFIRNRQFRATMVCHREAKLQRRLNVDSLATLRFGFLTNNEPGPIDLSPEVPHRFETPEGMFVSSSASISKAALATLRAIWPRTLPFDALVERALGLLQTVGLETPVVADARRKLATDLLECLLGGGLSLRTWEPSIATTVEGKPIVPAHTRVCSAKLGYATTLHHVRIDLDVVARRIAPLLDGTRDKSDVIDALVEMVVTDELTLKRNDEPEKDPSRLREPLGEVYDRSLAKFVAAGLLVEAPGV